MLDPIAAIANTADNVLNKGTSLRVATIAKNMERKTRRKGMNNIEGILVDPPGLEPGTTEV